MTNQDRFELIKKNTKVLNEHFDSVVIIATHSEGEETTSYKYSAGNHFASEAACIDFLRRCAEPQEDYIEDGDEWKDE